MTFIKHCSHISVAYFYCSTLTHQFQKNIALLHFWCLLFNGTCSVCPFVGSERIKNQLSECFFFPLGSLCCIVTAVVTMLTHGNLTMYLGHKGCTCVGGISAIFIKVCFQLPLVFPI